MLLLLTLISTLGGSIYRKEPFEEKELEAFWEEQQKQEDEQIQLSAPPSVPVTETFEEQEDTKPQAQVVVEDDVVEGFDGDQWATAM
jgi:hypothetical protein